MRLSQLRTTALMHSTSLHHHLQADGVRKSIHFTLLLMSKCCTWPNFHVFCFVLFFLFFILFWPHLAGSSLRDLDQLPEDGVVGALQRLHGNLLRHGALLDARLQQPVAAPEQVPARQVVSAECGRDISIKGGKPWGGGLIGCKARRRSHLWKAVSRLSVDRTL